MESNLDGGEDAENWRLKDWLGRRAVNMIYVSVSKIADGFIEHQKP